MIEYDSDDSRPFAVTLRGCKAPSSNWSDIRCPFCNNVVRAYHWSLAGGGKLCTCGAKHNSFGRTAPPMGKVYNPKKMKFVKGIDNQR